MPAEGVRLAQQVNSSRHIGQVISASCRDTDTKSCEKAHSWGLPHLELLSCLCKAACHQKSLPRLTLFPIEMRLRKLRALQRTTTTKPIFQPAWHIISSPAVSLLKTRDVHFICFVSSRHARFSTISAPPSLCRTALEQACPKELLCQFYTLLMRIRLQHPLPLAVVNGRSLLLS